MFIKLSGYNIFEQCCENIFKDNRNEHPFCIGHKVIKVVVDESLCVIVLKLV